MSGATADGSFVEAPPIPYQKRYLADVRNQSATTQINPTENQIKETKMRRNLHHPERDAATPVETSQIVKGAESEYYVMGEEAAAKQSQIVTGEGHMSAHASVSKGGGTNS